MEGIDGGLYHAVDGQSLGESEVEITQDPKRTFSYCETSASDVMASVSRCLWNHVESDRPANSWGQSG